MKSDQLPNFNETSISSISSKSSNVEEQNPQLVRQMVAKDLRRMSIIPRSQVSNSKEQFNITENDFEEFMKNLFPEINQISHRKLKMFMDHRKFVNFTKQKIASLEAIAGSYIKTALQTVHLHASHARKFSRT